MKNIFKFIAILSILNLGSLTTAFAASHEKAGATAESASTTTAEAKTENTEEKKKKKKADAGDEEPDCD